MRVRDIIREKKGGVITINANQNIHDAIGLLNEYGVGALIVKGEGGQVVGIITERDILRKWGEYADNMTESNMSEETAFSSLVQDFMTRELVFGDSNDDPDYAMGVMTSNHIRHLPILNEGSLAGIISIGDLVNAHLEEKVLDSRTLKEYLSR